MAEYFIQDTTLTQIANAIRSKTGGTDPIPVPDMAGQITGITTEGSSSDDVRYVTFLSEDGSVEYGKKPVAIGDDCADPLTRGLFATPTKASDVQYSYSFAGWASEPYGGLDAEALKAVSEDRMLYANFAAVVRSYTITYYDGDTVLKTVQVAYGATPPAYTPEKTGVNFNGWQPELAVVTGDASYYAQWTEALTFANGSWADIAAISESGNAATTFAVGDEKVITVGDSDITLVIIGFNHDDLADGTGKAGMTVMAKTSLADTMSVDDWSVLANTMKTQLKPQLPSDLQAVIKPVSKPCDVKQATAVVTPVNVEFELFPLSFEECKIKAFQTANYTNADWQKWFTTLGTTYTYFENLYSASWYGPMSSFWVAISNAGPWLRQWARFDTSTLGLYAAYQLSTSTKYYAKNTSQTSTKPVMLAFCI